MINRNKQNGVYAYYIRRESYAITETRPPPTDHAAVAVVSVASSATFGKTQRNYREFLLLFHGFYTGTISPFDFLLTTFSPGFRAGRDTGRPCAAVSRGRFETPWRGGTTTTSTTAAAAVNQRTGNVNISGGRRGVLTCPLPPRDTVTIINYHDCYCCVSPPNSSLRSPPARKTHVSLNFINEDLVLDITTTCTCIYVDTRWFELAADRRYRQIANEKRLNAVVIAYEDVKL